MRILLIIFTLNSFLASEALTLNKVTIQSTPLDISSTIISDEKVENTNSITLQDKLQTNAVFNSVIDAKGEKTISFRGLNHKNTEFVEDDIPMYRTTGGEVDTKFIMSSSKVEINDGSGASSMGVASMGGEVKLSSSIPSKEFESTLDTSISTNDEYYHAYVGTLIDNVYFQTNASFYNTNEYSLSNNFKATAIQNSGKRLNSDKNQKNISFKAGTLVNDSLHLAAKVSLSKSENGITPNIYTNITAPMFDAYSRIDKKDLGSFYLYADYEKNDLKYTLRAYYDEYSDIYAIYDDATYTSHQPLVTYDDKRIGTVLKVLSTQKNYKNTFILQVDENEHIRRGGGMNTAKYIVDSLKSSFLNQWYLNDAWQLESGLTYTHLQVKKAAESSIEDKQSLDAFMKLSYTDDTDSFYIGAAKKSRMPSMSEMLPFFPWEITNENLKEERSFQYSIGYRKDLEAKTSLNIALYYYDITDLIINRNNTFINRDKAEHYGSEIGVSNRYFNKHDLYFSYAYAQATDSDGENLELIPTHKIKIEDTLMITNDIQAYASYEHIGSRYSANSATNRDEQLKISSYNLVSMQLKYQISKATNTRVGVKNLFDKNYEYSYGYPSLGRFFYISLQINL